MPRFLHTLVALCAACLVGACGGGDADDPVQLCFAAVKPALHACLPPDYRGVDATMFASCIQANPHLVAQTIECRALDPQALRSLADHELGHQASVVLQNLRHPQQP